MKFSFGIISLLSAWLLAQHYDWPMETGTSLTSNFGEFRETHFHMGLDIKTNGEEGHPVYAVDDGYLSRMVTNFNGYGRALYLTTQQGNIVVYAHLDRFSPRFEPVLHIYQQKKESFFITNYFTQYEFPVKKGELLGYSGNSGSSSGPHLHFEIRTLDDVPLNPLTHGLSYSDHRSPVFRKIAFIPSGPESRVNGSPLPQIFPLFRDRSGTYLLPDTIHITGQVKIAVNVVDRREGETNIYQVKSLQLQVDDKEYFSHTYDQISYAETGLVNLAYSGYLARMKEGGFHALYKGDNDPPLPVEKPGYRGWLKPMPGFHTLVIKATDTNDNVSRLEGVIFSGPTEPVVLQAELSGPDRYVFSMEPEISRFPYSTIVVYTFNRHGTPEEELQPVIEEIKGKTTRFSLPVKALRGKALQVFGINHFGAFSQPAHWTAPDLIIDHVTIRPDFDVLDIQDGVFLQVSFNDILPADPELILEKAAYLTTIPLLHIQPAVYLSSLLDPALLESVQRVTVKVKPDSPDGIETITHFPWTPTLSVPGKAATALSADRQCSMRIPKTSLYDTAAVWIEKVEISAPVEQGRQLSPVYQLQPFTLTLRDTVQVGIKYRDEIAFEPGIGIYAYDPDDAAWEYLPSWNRPKRRVILASLSALDAVTIIQDTTPPVFISSFPAEGGYYQYQDVEILRFVISDDCSGIASNEASIQLFIDDERVYPAYQPVEQEFSYRLPIPLNAGEHTIRARAADNAGNSREKSISFSIN